LKELLRTTEPVFLSWVIALLKAEAIDAIVLDRHTSVLEGSTYAIPTRLMVADADHARARQLLTDAGEGDRLAKRP
jgi:Putative prokaryotic signal transducing protein